MRRRVAVPALRAASRVSVKRTSTSSSAARRFELVAVDHVVERAGRVQQPHGHLALRSRGRWRSIAAQRHDARAAGDEQQWPAERLFPDEVAADRARAARARRRAQLVDEIRRDLAVLEPLDGQHEVPVLRRRRDRVAALRLIAVLGGQAHVDVLARAMTGPVRRRRARCCARAASRRPARPPSRAASSVALVALFLPRIAVVVVAVALPEARLVLACQARARAPTSRSSRNRDAARAAARGRRAPARAARRRTRRRPTPCRRSRPRAAGWSCSRRR